MSVMIKFSFKRTHMKYAHLMTLVYHLVLVKQMQRFVTWLCFLHHAKE